MKTMKFDDMDAILARIRTMNVILLKFLICLMLIRKSRYSILIDTCIFFSNDFFAYELLIATMIHNDQLTRKY